MAYPKFRIREEQGLFFIERKDKRFGDWMEIDKNGQRMIGDKPRQELGNFDTIEGAVTEMNSRIDKLRKVLTSKIKYHYPSIEAPRVPIKEHLNGHRNPPLPPKDRKLTIQG